MNNPNLIQELRQLTSAERQTAFEKARKLTAGSIPDRKNYKNLNISKYPAWVNSGTLILCAVLLFAAFVPSSIRLYQMGFSAFVLQDYSSQNWAGLAIVLLSETGQVTFSLAYSILAARELTKEQSALPWYKTIHYDKVFLLLGIVLSTFIALDGNLELSHPWSQLGIFPWIEALCPTLLVISTATVLKSRILESIKERHSDEAHFRKDLKQWQEIQQNPEIQTSWMRHYANSLRETMVSVYGRTQHGRDIVQDLTNESWVALIQRELASDSWFVLATLPQPPRNTNLPTLNAPVSTPVEITKPELTEIVQLSNGKGKIIPNGNGSYTSICMTCDKVLGQNYSSFNRAKGVLSLHSTRMHKEINQ